MKFYLALWSSKTLLFILKLLKKERDDKPGLLAYRICNNFNEKITKPKITIAVTGTNGKTTVSSLIANIFKQDNKKVSFNDWGANTLAGHARCLIDTVNIFNKSKKDVAVLEVDEMTSLETLKGINPTYLIVTNIERDSIRRNDNPDYIVNKLQEAVKTINPKKIFLNADCPISSFLTNKNVIYYGVSKIKNEITNYKAKDFIICPKCYNEVEYLYQQYRSIGKFYCPKCNFKSIEPNYLLTIKENKCILSFDNKKEEYYIFSTSIFNLYNEVVVLSLFKELGYSNKKLNNLISKVKIPENRIEEVTINGVKVLKHASKGQNVSASSTVFEMLSHDNTCKSIVLLLNENYGNINGTETVTWLYETDFEFLNRENIKKIYVGGPRYLDYKLRLKLAGIGEEKIVTLLNEEELLDKIEFDGIKEIDILYEVDNVSKANYFYKYIVNKLSGEKNEN